MRISQKNLQYLQKTSISYSNCVYAAGKKFLNKNSILNANFSLGNIVVHVLTPVPKILQFPERLLPSKKKTTNCVYAAIITIWNLLMIDNRELI